MAFKGLEDRFLAKSKDLYNKYTTRDTGTHADKNNQPFLEWKPDSPDATETTHDTFSLPIGSTKRDIARLGAFLKSRDGLVFLLKEQALQLGNTFSETRILNPLFVVGNAVPYLHLRRPLTGENDFAPRGDTSHMSDAARDPKIRGAGRLQVGTSKTVIADVMGRSSISNLFGIFSTSNIIHAVTGLFSLSNAGSLGIDQRPELQIGPDQWFSITMWRGFHKQYTVSDNFSNISANLRIGNLGGAINSAKQTVKSAVSDIESIFGRGGAIPLTNLPLDGRNSSNFRANGRRYFITSPSDADRYLVNSIHFGTDGEGYDFPMVHTPYLDRRPYSNAANDELKKSISRFIEIKPNFSTSIQGFALSTFGLSNDAQTLVKSIGNVAATAAKATISVASKITDTIRNAIPTFPLNVGLDAPFSVTLHTDALRQLAEQQPAQDLKDNPAESAMLFKEISLHQRYLTDERMTAVKSALQAQKDASFSYWQSQTSNIGFESKSKLRPGQDANVSDSLRSGVRRYFHDKMNDAGVLSDAGDSEVSDTMLHRIRTEFGEDLVNVLFYDVVNKRVIPFRAFLSNLHESVNPEIKDTRYIGRIERNIVYIGATREISFSLMVHAFNDKELGNIWSKINYMTGLCYPAQYSNGFMVPPLVKLTIGDVFRDQPGYFKSLTHMTEDNTPWEISREHQAPHGITMNVSFTVIEKTQMQTGAKFYSYGEPRSGNATQISLTENPDLLGGVNV